jgi:AcrR family transcriptional regulator
MTPKPVSRTSEKTRQAVIDAAIHCLATEGYHRATSNRIARQAGLSWGVIQYHFADRAGIYRAVLDTIIASYVLELDLIAQSGKGKSVSERLLLLASSVWELLNHPAYLATMELLVNLTRDEELAINTKGYVKRWSERMAVMWQGIFPEFPEGHAGSAAARQIFFAALRGFVDNRLIGQWQSESIPKELIHSMALGLASIMARFEDGK